MNLLRLTLMWIQDVSEAIRARNALNTPYLFVFNPNARKYGRENLQTRKRFFTKGFPRRLLHLSFFILGKLE